MRTITTAVVAVLLTAAVCGAVPAQSIYGPSGLFIHPTAYLPRKGVLTFSASFLTQQIAGQRRTEWVPIGLSYGINDKLEVGALYVDRLGPTGSRRGSFGGFVRTQLLPETAHAPAVAFTASYVGSDVRLGSAAVSVGQKLHYRGRVAAIAHGGLQLAFRGDGLSGDSSAFGAFVGLEVPLGSGFALVGEYGTRFAFDAEARSSYGAMWRARNGLSVAAGFVNIGRSDDNRFFVGVGIPIGGNN